MKYGGVTLIAELRSTNQLANAITCILQQPVLPLKSKDVNELIKTVLQITKCIIDHFKELPSPDPKQEISVATSQMVIAVYMTIYSVVAMFARISIPSTLDKQKQSAEEELISEFKLLGSILGRELEAIKEIGQKQPEKATTDNIRTPDNLQIGQKKPEKATTDNIRISDNLQIGASRGNVWVSPILQKLCLRDNRKIQANEKRQTKTSQALTDVFDLKACFKTDKKQPPPLFDGSSKKQATFDILKKKNLLLLISDIDFISEEDHSILRQISTASQYDFEVLWLPIVDSIPMDDKKQKQFQDTQQGKVVPWSSVSAPSVLRPEFFKYAKDVWHFDKKPMVVVLDQQGTVVNTNSLHMIRIWGIRAVPFTSLREEELWKEERLNIEFLVRSIDEKVIDWIGEGMYVCLYGGRDRNWIQQIKDEAQEVARAANIQLKMLYLGKSYPGNGVVDINKSITSEKLSIEQISKFWARLDSMWHSMIKFSKSPESDPKLRQIMLLFEHDYSDQGWAAIGGGLVDQMAEAKGYQMLKSLTSFDVWKTRAMQNGFVAALSEQLHQYHSINLMLPGASAGNIPELLDCPKCKRQMEKFIGYHCPTD